MRRPLFVAALVGLCLAFVGDAVAGNAGFAPPDSATSSGSAINELYWIIIGITGLIFVLVEAALFWFIFRFRRRPETPDDAVPQIHGNVRLELLWTAIPVLIVIGIIVVTVIKVPSVEAKPAAGSDPLVVEVQSHTYYWEYTYPNGVVQVDTLTLPVGRPIQLRLTGMDVAHSWWVPVLTGKKDAIPGRTNTLNFTVRRPGVFEGQCAEFCGVQHAVMRTTVEAVPPAEFDTWLAKQDTAQANGTSNLGMETWIGVCAKCHGLDGKGDYGPAIAGNSTLSDPAVLGPLLASGQDNPGLSGYMPAVSQGWPQKQLDALVDYLVKSGIAPKPAQQGG